MASSGMPQTIERWRPLDNSSNLQITQFDVKLSSILCTVENLRIDEQDCGSNFSIRLTGDMNIA
jgi:hypothetical protein